MIQAADESSATILVVDDQEMNRDMLARRLARSGSTVICAEDGQQALVKISEQKFDLVLLDIMMPGMNGLEVLEAIRRDYSISDLPVIMATALNTGQDIVEALRLGANDYVTKPLDFAVVLARVNTQISLKRAKEQVLRLAEDLELKNRFIQHVFGRYVSPEVVAGLLESPEGLQLGGENRKVSVLMSDLRGFSSLAERLTPPQTVRLLNHYLGRMANVILRYEGMVNEFIGDSVLAIFGVPFSRENDTSRAVACAVEMQKAMIDVNLQNEKEGLPGVTMGIAVHTGEAVVGNIGSHERTKYGIVGPVVNLTARIESCSLPGQILISDAAASEVREMVQFGGQVSIQMKGFQEPVTVHEVFGIAGNYNLFLDHQEEPLIRLVEKIAITFSVLEGKRLSTNVHPANIVRLSATRAEIECVDAMSPHLNIRMNLLTTDGTPIAGEVYAKILQTPAESADSFVVHLTSLSQEAEQCLRSRLEAAISSPQSR